MKSKIILLGLFALGLRTSFAQVAAIDCSTERNRDNSISLIGSSNAFGEYTIKITFTSLTGFAANSRMFGNVFLATINGVRKELIKLNPQSFAGTTSLQYHYSYLPGRSLQKAPDSSFKYLLPGTPGNQLRTLKVSSLSEWVGPKSTENFYSAGFVYKLGDTICASRAGYVTDCNGNETGEAASETYRSSRNKLVIQHKDGSIATYSILAPIKLLIPLGSYVFPGQPLAVFNKESAKYEVLLSINYLDEKRWLADNAVYASSAPPSFFVYMPAHFYCGENESSIVLSVNKEYMVQHPKELVALEMSKRDKKKMGF